MLVQGGIHVQWVGCVLWGEQVVPAPALQLHTHSVVLAVSGLQRHSRVQEVQQR